MLRRKLFPLLVIAATLALLVPGLTQPMITLKADLNRQALVNEGKKLIKEQNLHPAMTSMATQFLSNLKVEGQSRVYDKTRSILGTAKDLWDSGYQLVALLIVLFSVVIPTVKILCLMLVSFLSSSQAAFQRKMIRINGVLSKWSMADVFAMGVLIACLAANASNVQSAVIQFSAQLHGGFYWFVGYCLLASTLGQLVERYCVCETITPH